MKKKLKIDNSMITTFAGCHAKGIAEYVHNRSGRGEKLHAEIGQIGHNALETHFFGAPVEVVIAQFEAEYDLWSADKLIEDLAMTKTNISAILRTYCMRCPIDEYPFRILETERPINVDLDFCLFTAKRDALVEMKITGKTMALDHKFRFGAINDWWTKKFKHNSQFSGYIYLNSLLSPKSAAQIWINAISLKKLPNSNRKCKTHGCPYSECGHEHAEYELLSYVRNDYQIENWLKSLKYLVGAYEHFKDVPLSEVPATGAFTDSCMFCGLSDWCTSGFDPDLKEEFTTDYVWEPWNH